MPRASGLFFKAVIKVVLLFVVDLWVVTSCMGKSLVFFSYPGGDTVDSTAPAEYNGQDVVIHLGNGSKGGGGVLDNGGIRQAAQEHGRTENHYAITVRPA